MDYVVERVFECPNNDIILKIFYPAPFDKDKRQWKQNKFYITFQLAS